MRFNLKLFIVLFMTVVYSFSLKGQFVNNGSNITLQSGAILNVSGDFNNISGTINNFGNISLTGNWVNNDAQGVFTLASTGSTTFNGADQTIGGTQKTSFVNLNLSGTGVKKLLVNTDVRSTLNLNDRELALEDKNLEVLSTATNSILYTTGYVSANLKGLLYRNTNVSDNYTYPFAGIINSNLVYRPIVVKPKDNLNNSIGISFVPKNPTSDGYNTAAKRFDVNEVNPLYYYLADQKSGTSQADFNFYYDYLVDGDFNQLVNWIKFNMWEKAGISNQQNVTGNNLYNRVMTLSTLQPVSMLPLTFSSITPTNSPITIFNSFSPDGDGKNDTWEIKNIDLFPDNELTILNRWGSEILKVKGYNNANAWDGAGLNNGTYFYLLKVNINNEAKVYKGFITLLKND